MSSSPCCFPSTIDFFDYHSRVKRTNPSTSLCLFPTLNDSASASLETIPRAHCKDRSLLVLSPSPHDLTGSLVHHPSSTPISPRELVANRHLTTAGLTLALPIKRILLATHPPSTNATPHCEHLDNKIPRVLLPLPVHAPTLRGKVASTPSDARRSSICMYVYDSRLLGSVQAHDSSSTTGFRASRFLSDFYIWPRSRCLILLAHASRTR